MNLQTIKIRIIILAIVLILVSIIVRLMVAMPSAQGVLRDMAAGQQLAIARYIARDVQRSIEMRGAFVETLAETLPVELLDQPVSLAAWLDERRRITPLFKYEMLVIDSNGRAVLARDPALAALSAEELADSPWFRAALEAAAPVIGTPRHDPTAREPIIIIAMPIRDPVRGVVAVLAGLAQLDGPGFFGLRDNALGMAGSFSLVLPASELVIGSGDSGMMLVSMPTPGANLLHDRAMGGYRGTGVVLNERGEEELAAIAGVPGTAWFVEARMPMTEVFRPIDSLYRFAWISTVFILFVVLSILLVCLPRILRPLTETANAMRDMASGKRPLEPLPVMRKDEVGGLVVGFNALATCLREKEVELKANEARMAYLAHHDSLTGLYNRQMLEIRLQHTLEHAQREATCFALLFCDLDFFKPINDTHGHDVGDQVLLQVADRLMTQRRRSDTVARLGGDEFVILLPGTRHARHDAQALAQEYLQTIATPYSVGEHTFTLSVSIGIAVYQGLPISASQLLSQADRAMYRAKRAGKNRICFFDDESMTTT